MTDWREWLKEAARIASAIVAVLTVVWFIGKPHAEGLISDTVKRQGYASKYQVDEVNRQVEKNGSVANEVRDRSIRVETTQQLILQLLKEQRQILQDIKRG